MRKAFKDSVVRVVTGSIAAVIATMALAAPAQAAMVESRYDICAALRNGASLAAIETTLESRGYSASNAGTLTGTTIRQHCPEQVSNVVSQVQFTG